MPLTLMSSGNYLCRSLTGQGLCNASIPAIPATHGPGRLQTSRGGGAWQQDEPVGLFNLLVPPDTRYGAH